MSGNKNRKYIPNDELPPPYPNGWFAITESHKIKNGEIKSFKYFGTELAVFRGHSGEVSVMDAYCPHLGANIAIGGTVIDNCGNDCVKCPFHGWTFRGSDGLCLQIPDIESKNYLF